MQGAQVQALIREDSTCCRATKLVSTTTEACVPTAHAPQQVKPLQWEALALQLESSLSLTATREPRV